jgi:hypothetical protein
MLENKLQEEKSLGSNTVRLPNYGMSSRAFPIETIDLGILNKEDVRQ